MNFSFLLLGFIFKICRRVSMHIRNSITSVCIVKRKLKKKATFILRSASRESVICFNVVIRITICLCFLSIRYIYKSATSCGCIMLKIVPGTLSNLDFPQSNGKTVLWPLERKWNKILTRKLLKHNILWDFYVKASGH